SRRRLQIRVAELMPQQSQRETHNKTDDDSEDHEATLRVGCITGGGPLRSGADRAVPVAGIVAAMAFRIGGNVRRVKGGEDEGTAIPVAGPLVMEQPLWPTIPVPHEVDRLFAQAFALVGEGIAGATHALLAGDRDAAKLLVRRDDVIDQII